MADEIINKVAQSGIVTVNLEEFIPTGERVLFDIKEYLYKGLILKEKDFREKLTAIDWASFKDKFVAIHNSTDAIVPIWAYMLVASYLHPNAKAIVYGNPDALEAVLIKDALSKIIPEDYRDKRVMIKGCSDKIAIPVAAFVELTRLLKPVVKSIFFGEPCSTVPIWKR